MARYFVVTSLANPYSSAVGELGTIHKEVHDRGDYHFLDGVYDPLMQSNMLKGGIEEVSSLDDLIRTNEKLSIR